MTRIRTTLALASISIAALVIAGCGSDTASLPAAATPVIGTTSAEPSATTALPATTITTAAPVSSAASTSASAPAAAVAVDPATFDNGSGVVGWVSPSGNIYCKLADPTLESGCQSGDAPIGEAKDCVTPSFTIDQLSRGFVITPDSVEPHCFNQGIFGVENPKTLPYDQSITFKGFTCTSRTTGMSCINGTGHGFVLSMQEARSF